MDKFDIIIVGGGITGLATACALSKQGFTIAVIEQQQLTAPDSAPAIPYARVSALNAQTVHFLNELKVWESLTTQRLAAYQQIEIWQKESCSRLHFSAQDYQMQNLGYIVENTLLQQTLYQQACLSNDIRFFENSSIESLKVNDEQVLLSLSNGAYLLAKLVIGADGAHSKIRQQANIPLSFRDYGHTALVATIQTKQPHAATAYQVFSEKSILAFLPLYDANLCSIVWSLPPEQANQLQQLPTAEFLKRLRTAFDNRLGECQLLGGRHLFPLTARYARDFAAPRVVLVGDAAHTIHPLAGQGVNLGLVDVALLVETVQQLAKTAKDIGYYRYWRTYERTRKYEAMKMLAAMQGFKLLFNNPFPALRRLSATGLAVFEQQQWLKEHFVRQANGKH